MNLTIKQEQILLLAARGMKDRSIAERMGISVRTVQNHLSRIYTKILTSGRVGAVLLYMSTKEDILKKLKQRASEPESRKNSRRTSE